MKKDKSTTNDNNKSQEPTTSANDAKDSSGNVENEKRQNPNRRAFLGKIGGGLLAGGLLATPALRGKLGTVAAQTSDLCPVGCEIVPLSGAARADAAQQRRINAAAYERNMIIPMHPCNRDEERYATRNFFASYTKGLRRAQGAAGSTFGEVDASVYCALLRAIKSGLPNDFEQVKLGFNDNCDVAMLSDEAARLGLAVALQPNRQRRLESPQAGYNFDLEGKDYYQLINRPRSLLNPVAFPPAFAFESAEEAVEIIENYWQALTRDVPFIKYEENDLVIAASTDLSQFAQYYGGPFDPIAPRDGQVTPRVYSRGILSGDTTGPFVSQFLLRDNIPYGAQRIRSLIRSPQSGTINDFLTTQPEWLQIQKGQTPDRTIAPGGARYIRNGRDLGAYVQNDAIYQAYLNAALLLLTPPDPTLSRDSADGGLGVPLNPNNPYRIDLTVTNRDRYCKQLNFVELGPSQLLSMLGEVSVRAHKAVWYQKWQVHRRLRPEEFGGRVHFNFTSRIDPPPYPISPVIYQSGVFGRVASNYNGAYFLPQAYPEGSPIHPAYGAGHATLAGACVTILKAWFDSELPYSNFAPFFQANANGDALVSAPTVGNTVADELNKLASNVSIARNIAGVHWRSDYTESVFLGEQVAIQLLADYGFTYNENFQGFRFRNFNGNIITVGGTRTT